MKLSMLELYNETLRDLLTSGPERLARGGLLQLVVSANTQGQHLSSCTVPSVAVLSVAVPSVPSVAVLSAG